MSNTLEKWGYFRWSNQESLSEWHFDLKNPKKKLFLWKRRDREFQAEVKKRCMCSEAWITSICFRNRKVMTVAEAPWLRGRVAQGEVREGQCTGHGGPGSPQSSCSSLLSGNQVHVEGGLKTRVAWRSFKFWTFTVPVVEINCTVVRIDQGGQLEDDGSTLDKRWWCKAQWEVPGVDPIGLR